MPLIIMCGRPSTGKTRAAQALAAAVEARGGKALLLNDEALHLHKVDGYKDSTAEKMTRGAFKSSVERSVSNEVVVIADQLNYIKGFRYELYCLARAAATTHCVVFVDALPELAAAWNAKRADGYDPEMAADLASRFESPDDRNRWDTPLFRVTNHGTEGPGESKEEGPMDLPVDKIIGFVLDGKAAGPSVSTLKTRESDTSYLHVLEKVTNDISSTLLTSLSTAVVGDVVVVPGAPKIRLSRKPTGAEVRRLKRQFLKMAKTYPPTDAVGVGKLFADYVTSSLASGGD